MSKVAVIQADKFYTYDELNAKVNELKNILPKSEVVVLLGGFSFLNIAIFLALYENKNVIVPINSQNFDEIALKSNEANADKTISVKDDEFNIKSVKSTKSNPLTKRLINAQKSGLIIFSSGTLSKPKAILHDLENLRENLAQKRQNNLRILLFLLSDHIGGINTLLSGLASASTLVITDDFGTKNICDLIQKHKINVLPTTPSFLNLLLLSKDYEKHDFSSLRLITYGTEKMSKNLLNRLKTAFKKVKFIQTFGTSESGIMSISQGENTLFSLNENEYKIVNNELYLKSKTAFLGYLNTQNENSYGWFKTGDLARKVGDKIEILGRNKELINVGGNKLIASEIEELILELTQIKDVVVYPLKNEILGQVVACDLVCDLSLEEAKMLIRNFLKERVLSYKIPVKFNIVKQIKITDRFKKDRKFS